MAASPFHNRKEYRKSKSNLLMFSGLSIYVPNVVGED